MRKDDWRFGLYQLAWRFVVFVVLPLIAFGIAFRFHIRNSLPERESGSIAVGVSSTVNLSRDANGITFIRADVDRDAFFALGYAHAQDRLWQLEIQKRIAQGRLAEVFGKGALESDIWMRTLGVYASAESSWGGLGKPARESLSAYASGINAYLERKPVLPPEFKLFDVEPLPWREIDSLAWSKVFALSLAGNMKSEVANWVAAQYLSAGQLTDLGLTEVPLKGLEARSAPIGMLEAHQNLEHRLGIGGRHVGSNAWVVAGSRMMDRRAAIANDTHSRLQIPSLWYVASLKGDRLNVAGMTMVGLPVVYFGRNEHIAWGGASMAADVQDLYLEQPNPTNPREYARDGQWRSFDTRTESIVVRADFPAVLRAPIEPVVIEIRSTNLGPIVSDVVGAIDQPVSLRWTALQAQDKSYEALLRVNYANDWSSFRSAFEHFVAPAMNLVYADDQNNIGSLGVGLIPVRSKDTGRFPVPAWTGEHRWTGYVPFAELPQQFNPTGGVIVAANDGPAGPDGGHFISADWAPPGRAERIRELLEQGGEKLSLDDFQRIQVDTVDKGAAALAAHLRTIAALDMRQEEALSYLAQWGGDMRENSVAATIFQAWTRRLREEFFHRSLAIPSGQPSKQSELHFVMDNVGNGQLLRMLTDTAGNWCDGAAPTPCVELLQSSLASALRELEKLRGKNMANWRWGDVHRTVYGHLGLSGTGIFAGAFDRRIGNGGSSDTINVADATFRDGEGYEQRFGPGFRQVMQFRDDGSSHRFINSTGQSGNVLSQHYDDMVRPFRDGMVFELGDGQDSAAWLIRLVPVQN